MPISRARAFLVALTLGVGGYVLGVSTPTASAGRWM